MIKKSQASNDQLPNSFYYCTQSRGRTGTGVNLLVFETSASTDSAIWALPALQASAKVGIIFLRHAVARVSRNGGVCNFIPIRRLAAADFRRLHATNSAAYVKLRIFEYLCTPKILVSEYSG